MDIFRVAASLLAVAAASGAAAVTAQAGPVTQAFASGMAEVDEGYRSAATFPSGDRRVLGVPRFAEAYSKLSPLIGAGLTLDDPVERYKFARTAAYVSCLAGVPTDAKRYAALAVTTFGMIPEPRRYPASQEEGAPNATADGFALQDMIENDGPRFYGRRGALWMGQHRQ